MSAISIPDAERLLGIVVTRHAALHGGDLSAVVRLWLADGRTAIAKGGPDPRAEAHMLRQIAGTGAPAPRVLASDAGLLILEDLPEGAPLTDTGWRALGRHLRVLHGQTGQNFGWPDDYAFGPVAIDNRPLTNWPEFWAERRLRPFLPHLPPELARDLDALCHRLADLLPADPRPALLHGDLWSGNIVMNGDHVSGLIDPACYHGDGEVDLAMLDLFGSLPAAFLDGYGPRAPGWRTRRAIYQLWPALVHLRLFGMGYARLVTQLLAQAATPG